MEAEKRTNAERNEQEDILAALKYLTESVEGLKAEIAALHAENEQLKQSIQTADLAFIISLAGINNTNEQFAIDYLKVANYFIDDRIIQYLARVALAKHINDMTEENNAYRWVEDKLKYSDIYKEISKLNPKDTLQLVLECETEEEKDFYEMVGDYLLQKKQREVLGRNAK